ncbi:uncharacterized protein VTP21DRAFT_2012 [Calcarisporiella thermophila]|uniref:uncharacterized protein n=1 Tax=Calcarisporiella thermophila TaxID=911321 RepID=UPI003743BA2B
MVTFTSDFWAPAADVKVRRRLVQNKVAVRHLPQLNDFHAEAAKPVAVDEASDVSLLIGNELIPTSTLQSTITTNTTISQSELPSSYNMTAANSTPNSKKVPLMPRLFHRGSHKSDGTASPRNETMEYEEEKEKKHVLSQLWAPIMSRKDSSNSVASSNSSHDSKPSRPLSPASLEKYGVKDKRCIGKGATAVVRVAHNLNPTQPVRLYAIKEFRRGKNVTEKEHIKKLTSEFCISSTLRHENIVQTVDLVQDENRQWCEVMEFCAGGDLYAAIKSGHMTRLEIDCCFKQLITGLDYIHANGVAHRDIKPENLLLSDRGQLKIADFGVSEVFRAGWETCTHKSRGVCGSEPYIAPEVFTGEEYDARCLDVWSAGIVYYSMTYRGIPFRCATSEDSNYRAYLESRLERRFEPFERLGKSTCDLMYRILDPDSARRITIPEIMENEWIQRVEVCENLRGKERFHVHFCKEDVPTGRIPGRA